ncbi:leucine-rich repeat domain-containing protein [Acanthopleuribacter pedis]|uniref:Leucine-rich repeat domain-containing protein n=1 Tax=Acanthopleuribacter pedis TaxID=442870 RepID=A0A8J7U0T0_9BACT|nr:hypothetical protein [Acanthopleuribacter pedis]MBO1317403.1 hypothetical protein [Acanthopleuribacter pedis]
MRKKHGLGLGLLGMVLMGPLLLAQTPHDIEIGRQSRELDGHGRATDLGLFQVDFRSDVAADASATEPLYLRVSLSAGATLAETLVGPGEGSAFRPIYLPLLLVSSSQTALIQAPADTAAVVRWVAGENQIWIRFTASSSTWIGDGKVQRAPNEDETVRLWLGASAAAGWARLARDYAAGRANLPAPTFNPSDPSREQAVSLLFCGDLFYSTTTPSFNRDLSGVLSQADFFKHSQRVTTATALDEIDPGDPVNLEIHGNAAVQVQQGPTRFRCDMEATVLRSGFAEMCRDTVNQPDPILLDAALRVSAQCGSAEIRQGSRLALAFPVEGAFGFQVAVDGQGLPLSATSETGVPDTYWLVEETLFGNDAFSRAWCFAADLVDHTHGLVSRTAQVVMNEDIGAVLALDLQARVVARERVAGLVAAPHLSLFVPGEPVEPSFPPPFSASWQAERCRIHKTFQQTIAVAGLFETRPCSFVEFADQRLELAVIDAHDQNNDQRLDEGEALQVTELDLTGLGVTSLDGMARLTRLQRLRAGFNAFTDLSPLLGLGELADLDLSNNDLTDPLPLLNLAFLFQGPGHRLDVRGNQFTDDSAHCFVFSTLASRIKDGESVLLVNPQSSGRFYGRLPDWHRTDGSVLELVATVNRLPAVIAPYTLCEDAQLKGGRP